MKINLAKQFKKGWQSLALALALIPTLAAPALADTVSLSVTDLTVSESHFSFDIELQTDQPFAGAEFSLKPSAGISIDKVELLGIAANTGNVQTVKDGLTHFGFFTIKNSFALASETAIARVSCSINGSDSGRVEISSAQVITVDEQENVTSHNSASLPVLTVTSADEGNDNGSSGGGGGGSQGDDEADGTIIGTLPDVDIADNQTALSELPDWVSPFNDVALSDWFYNAVSYAVQNGLFEGVSTDMFSPNGEMTRAMLVTVLHRMEGEPLVDLELSYSDVLADTWYTEAVRWATAEGIVDGMSASSFAPNSPISREQVATILYRYAQSKGHQPAVGGDLSAYADNSSISAYALPAMQWANQQQIITGMDSQTIAPQNSASRAEVATILMRYLNLY